MVKESTPSKVSAPDPLEVSLRKYVDDYVRQNRAAQIIAKGLQAVGIGFWPVVDHLTFRTLEIDERAKEFLKLGYAYDSKLGILEYNNWFAKVYRKTGFPALFIDQAYSGEKGKGSLIPDWVKAFGDQTLHHVAIRVEDVATSVTALKKQGVKFAGEIVGEKNSDLRQIFTDPEMKQGKTFSVVELTERHRGYGGFSPPQANQLMESTRISY